MGQAAALDHRRGVGRLGVVLDREHEHLLGMGHEEAVDASECVDGVRRTYEGTEGAPNAPNAVRGRCIGSGVYAGQLIGFAYLAAGAAFLMSAAPRQPGP